MSAVMSSWVTDAGRADTARLATTAMAATNLREVGAVVEGYYAAASVKALSERLGVELPICRIVYGILYENADATKAVHELMSRDRRSEFDYRWDSE